MDRSLPAFLPLLALLLTATASPGPASAAAAPSLDVPAVVTAGRTVTLRWSPLPGDVEEAEIVLSLDGGRSYHVRVSPEVEARAGGYRWTVPDLPAARARLMLRVGGEGGERAGPVSREFRIVHADGLPPADCFHEGQCWTGLAPLGGHVAAGIVPNRPAFAEPGDGAPCGPPEPLARAATPAPAPAVPALPASPPPPPDVRIAGAMPRQVPLRI